MSAYPPPTGQPPPGPPYVPPYGQQPMPPGYGPPPMGYPPYGYAPQPAKSLSTAAIVSFAFGIGAWIILPFLAAIVAVISGHMARNEIRASQGRLEGDGFAIAGMILGYIQLALTLIVAVVVIWLIVVYNQSGANEALLF